RWARMDGGGDIPDGMIYDRHINATANIAWSKIAHPTDLAVAADITALEALVDGLDTRVSALEPLIATLIGTDTGLSVRDIAEDAIADAGLTGTFVTLDT